MKSHIKLLTCAVSLVLTGCGTVSVPDNVKTAGDYINNIRYSHTPAVDFAKVKQCVALNISNDNVRLTDNNGSFVGQYTGRYYNINNSHTDFAPNTLVTIDEFHRYLIVNGNTYYTARMIGNAVRFKLQIQVRPNNNEINLLFDNITRAQLNTGSLSNTGFTPVGVWYGAGTEDVIKAIDIVKNNLTDCFNN